MHDASNLQVITTDGVRGYVETTSNAPADETVVLVRLESGRTVQAPRAMLTRQEDGSFLLPLSSIQLEQLHAAPSEISRPVAVLPVIAEELSLGKRSVETGRIRITKHVREQEETVEEPLLHEEVMVERVPKDQIIEGPAPSIRQEGEITVIPVVEEFLVVEKRLRLKEEIHISHLQKIVREPLHVTLHREEISVERIGQILSTDEHNDR